MISDNGSLYYDCSCGHKLCTGSLIIYPDSNKKGDKFIVVGTADDDDATEAYLTFEQIKELLKELNVKLLEWEKE